MLHELISAHMTNFPVNERAISTELLSFVSPFSAAIDHFFMRVRVYLKTTLFSKSLTAARLT